MRFTRKILALGFLLCAATASLAGAPQNPPPELQSELVGYSSSDFARYGPPVESFRDVHIRYEALPSGGRSYLLCGQFRAPAAGSHSPWTNFATIKTDPYEQWIGNMAQAHCERATAIATEPQDLSAVLKARLDATEPE